LETEHTRYTALSEHTVTSSIFIILSEKIERMIDNDKKHGFHKNRGRKNFLPLPSVDTETRIS
jgi:hypothetical protein